MVLSYFASSSVGIILMLILFAGLRWEIIPAAVTAVGVVLLLTPILYRTSRLLWIHIDHAADPSQKPKNSL